MRDVRPGDLVLLPVGTYQVSATDNVQCWSDSLKHACVISKSSYRIIESDQELSGMVMVFIPNEGVFHVEELGLMTLDEYEAPSRLFPKYRLSEG